MDYKVYFVATPIGNLEDITLRALRILKEVDTIACEDTRESKKLLDYYKIKKPLLSYHKFNEKARSLEIIDRLKAGETFAVISDQGMTGISDPGQVLLRSCIKEEIPYTVLPGPSSILTALIGSGFDNNEFSYYGFIPKKSGDKKLFYQKLIAETKTSIILDTPHNLVNTINDFKKIFPERKLCLARELTKKFEEYKRLKISDINPQNITLKGEMVLILEGGKGEKEKTIEDYNEEIENLKACGLKTKEIVKKIREESNLPKNQIYDYVINFK